jgi:hypothetical protein
MGGKGGGSQSKANRSTKIKTLSEKLVKQKGQGAWLKW